MAGVGIIGSMNRALPGRIFFTAAYILLAVGFLTIHFTQVDNYSTVVSTMVLKGRSSIGTAVSPPQIRRLKININGLELLFRKSSKAVLITDDGIRHPVDVTSWSSDETSITVEMENETGFILTSDSHGTGITLTPIIPAAVPPVRSIELPFRPESRTSITLSTDRPETLAISFDDQEFIADLPSDSTWNSEKGRLNLVVLEKATPVLAISEDERGGGLEAAEWYEQGAIPSEAAYTQLIDNWVIKSKEGWDTRLDSRTGLWLDAAGESRWSDLIASAILAESVQNGQLASTLQNITSIAANAPRDLGWLPSPYLGNIVNQTRVRNTKLQNSAITLTKGIAAGTPDFKTTSALMTLIDASRPGDAEKMLNLVRSAPAAVDTANSEVLARISILQEARKLAIDDSIEDAARRKGYFDAYILPRVFWVKDGLWLIEEDGSIDPVRSIRAGELLIQEALWTNDGLYQSVGRQLIMSSLAYADEKGAIPERILFEGDGEVVKEGGFPPENLYHSIVSPQAYPRHISLSEELGSGSWALTGAERFTLRSTPRETTIALDYPSGSIHHLAIRGVKPFEVLYMNGIKWNGDPNFQRYYAGWYYEAATETLFIKIRHRTKTENIRILYYNPDAPATVTTEEEAAEVTTPVETEN